MFEKQSRYDIVCLLSDSTDKLYYQLLSTCHYWILVKMLVCNS